MSDPRYHAGEEPPPAEQGEEFLLSALRQGSEKAFGELVERYHKAMIRLAMTYVSSPALAEEVAQETWIAIIKGVEQFEGRSSLKTWMFRILINRALSHAEREGRDSRFLRASGSSSAEEEPLVDPSRFHPADHPLAGHWLVPPRGWTPEERLLSTEMREQIENAIETLPVLQRQVVILRDVEGWNGREVCELFGISDANQRVLLHRARVKLRNLLEALFTAGK